VPLRLIAGPANAGKVELLLGRYLDALDAGDGAEPVLIVPNWADVDRVQFELLTRRGALLGGSIGTFEDVFRRVAAGSPDSRPVVDSGWLPKARQVGKSGMTVRPKLYIALGISGAPEHLQGMKDAEFIVAVNTDSSAPIFETAHIGVVADALEFVPALTERLSAGE